VLARVPGNPGQEHGTTENETSKDRSEMGSIFQSLYSGHGSCVQPYYLPSLSGKVPISGQLTDMAAEMHPFITILDH
jgi:hypothetical protein